ncbi:MAG: extracellular solute-binding protein [Candidatus Liptonbacteria bacterium]|nr:extracellular solute-binding protein [Candidatus Liptonbacteria bacterium]
MNLSALPRKYLFIGAVALAAIAAGTFLILGRRTDTNLPDVALTVWGVEAKEAFAAVITGYESLRPNAEVDYVEIPEARYERELVNALAAGKGPDVFMLQNRALPAEQDKLVPAHPTQLDLARFRELYPTVAEVDFTAEGQVFAVPLSVDTLILFYNRDLFDRAAVVGPPKTWQEFQSVVPALKSVTPAGQVVQAAAAIGGTLRSVAAAVDILNLLMMQNGVPMRDGGSGRIDFAPRGAGLSAFDFYLQFANPISPFYTWNDNQGDALQSFAAGKTAMLFAYGRDAAEIRARAPFLRIGVAEVPQASTDGAKLAYPSYWGLAVSKQSANAGWGWDFAVYAASAPQAADAYRAVAGGAPALRTLIAAELGDAERGVFARQALTARSWSQPDRHEVQRIFNDAISSVLSGRAAPRDALERAEAEAKQLTARPL